MERLSSLWALLSFELKIKIKMLKHSNASMLSPKLKPQRWMNKFYRLTPFSKCSKPLLKNCTQTDLPGFFFCRMLIHLYFKLEQIEAVLFFLILFLLFFFFPLFFKHLYMSWGWAEHQSRWRSCRSSALAHLGLTFWRSTWREQRLGQVVIPSSAVPGSGTASEPWPHLQLLHFWNAKRLCRELPWVWSCEAGDMKSLS